MTRKTQKSGKIRDFEQGARIKASRGEPIEISPLSQAAGVTKEMTRDHQRPTCQRSFCAGLMQARGDCQYHLLLLAEPDPEIAHPTATKALSSLEIRYGSVQLIVIETE